MPDASQVSQYIKLSVYAFLAAQLPGVTLQLDDELAPVPTYTAAEEAMAQPPAKTWVDVRMGKLTPQSVMSGGTRRQKWLVFLDCWSRIKGDRFKNALDGLADSIRVKLTDAWVTLFDFTDRDNPVDTGYKVRLSIDGDDPMPKTDLVYGRSLTVGVQYIERR